MARIRITAKTIEEKINAWSQGKETDDELIYFNNEVEPETWKQKAWDSANMIIEVQPDVVSGFYKIVFKEKL